MDLDSLANSLGRYFREFLAYIETFLARPIAGTYVEHVSDSDDRLVLHATACIFLGIFLQLSIVGDKQPTQESFLVYGSREVVFWLYVTIVVQVLARVFGRQPRFETTLSAILRTLPPAFVLATFVAFLASAITFVSVDAAKAVRCAPWGATLGQIVSEIALVAYGLPFALIEVTDKGAVFKRTDYTRIAVVVLAVVAIGCMVDVVPLSRDLKKAFDYCSA